MKPQCKEVLKYIQWHGSITQADAIEFGCFRLAARISDLEKEGVPIASIREAVIKADGSKTYIARYYIPKEAVWQLEI